MKGCKLESNVPNTTLALRGIEVSVHIHGVLATTTLTQSYQNDTQQNLEISYTFPVPVDGVLLDFAVHIGSRNYHGQVLPRQDAETAYETALAKGDYAFRLQKVREGLYSVALGNILSGEAVRLCITYAEPLPWNGAQLRYRLPTTIAPRYGKPDGITLWQRPFTSVRADYPLALQVQIHGALARSTLSCPSHPISLTPGKTRLDVALAHEATLDRDFVLDIENGAIQSVGTRASANATHVALLTLLPPALPAHTHERDTIIVLDCSASMRGNNLELAKEGVALALDALTEQEHFALLAFGDHCIAFDDAFQPANRRTLQYAKTFLSALDTMGGTEMSAALEYALTFDRGRARDILLLTDGEVWMLDSIIEQACAENVRIFTIGIGSAVAEDTVRVLADRTAGACALVAPGEAMARQIARHFARMRQPKLSALNIAWPTAPLWEARPQHACFAGDAYSVMAAFAHPVPPSVGIEYVCAGQAPVTLELPLSPAENAASALVQIAAHAHLPQLDAQARSAWAVSHQLITEQTDYLITLARSPEARATDLPELHVVPHMLAHCWGQLFSAKSTTRGQHTPTLFIEHEFCRDMSPNRDTQTRTESSGDAYLAFLAALSARAKHLLSGSLPQTKAELINLGALEEIVQLFDVLLAEGATEASLICALLQALIAHHGATLLSAGFIAKVHAQHPAQSDTPEHSTRFRLLLNILWLQHGAVRAQPTSLTGIPAFLRNMAN